MMLPYTLPLSDSNTNLTRAVQRAGRFSNSLKRIRVVAPRDLLGIWEQTSTGRTILIPVIARMALQLVSAPSDIVGCSPERSILLSLT